MAGEFVRVHSLEDARRHEKSGSCTEVFVGYRPRFDAMTSWERVWERHVVIGANETVYRASFLHNDRQQRIQVRLVQARSTQRCARAMKKILRAHQLERGPSGQAVAPSCTCQGVRANLGYSIVSYGAREADLLPWSGEIEGDLGEIPHSNEDAIAMTFDRTSMTVKYKAKWETGVHAWRYFLTSAGTIELAEQSHELLVDPEGATAPVTVTGYVVEPGRETYRGSARIDPGG